MLLPYNRWPCIRYAVWDNRNENAITKIWIFSKWEFGDVGMQRHDRGRLLPGRVHAGLQQRRTGTTCIKIGLPGKLILGDYFQENRTSRRPFLLLRICFPGRPIFIQLVPGRPMRLRGAVLVELRLHGGLRVLRRAGPGHGTERGDAPLLPRRPGPRINR